MSNRKEGRFFVLVARSMGERIHSTEWSFRDVILVTCYQPVIAISGDIAPSIKFSFQKESHIWNSYVFTNNVKYKALIFSH